MNDYWFEKLLGVCVAIFAVCGVALTVLLTVAAFSAAFSGQVPQ